MNVSLLTSVALPMHAYACMHTLIQTRIAASSIWSEWRLTVIAATVRIALVDILDLSEVDIPVGGFLYPAVGWD